LNNKVDISIVIPFHNEQDSLKELIPLLYKTIKEIPHKHFEVIMIDDVSTDNSAEFVAGFMNQKDNLKLLQLDKRGGQTGCYKIAFEQAKGDFIIRMDADLQDDPRDLPAFVQKIDEGSELIIGLRECRKHRRLIRLASGVYDLLILALFDSPFHSNSASYVAFKSKLVKNIPWRNNDHRYIPLIVMKRGAKMVNEVVVRHNARKFGESKYQPFKKLIFGIPEILLFLIRYSRGEYDFRNLGHRD